MARERLLDRVAKVAQPIGFAQQPDFTEILAAGEILGIARGEQDLDVWVEFTHPPGDVMAAKPARHDQIAEHQVGGEAVLDHLDRSYAVGRLMNPVAELLEAIDRQVAYPLIIFDDEDGLAGDRFRFDLGIWLTRGCTGLAGARKIDVDRGSVAGLAVDG